MYDELVKSLRLCISDKRGHGCGKECVYGKKHPLNWWCMDYLLREAADTIEELSAFKAQITDGRFYVYKLGTLFELRRDPRELVVRHQDPTEPPKEEVYGQYTDTAGDFHWYGTHSGEHTIKAEEGE